MKKATVNLCVEFVTIETPYGDTFVISDSFLNFRGDVVKMWSTVKCGIVVKSPDHLVKEGYKIISREHRNVSYFQRSDGRFIKVFA